MKTTGSGVAVLLVVAAMLAAQAAADVSCPDVVNDLTPCLAFLQASAPQPTGQCCVGVRSLYAAADTRAARQATCRCLKAAYVQAHAQLARAQALPGDCGVPINYTISPDIDCDQIE